MPVFLALLGGGLLGTVIGFIIGQKKTTQELAGGMTNAAQLAGETLPGAGGDGRWPGDPNYAPVPPGQETPATSTSLESTGLPWYLEPAQRIE